MDVDENAVQPTEFIDDVHVSMIRKGIGRIDRWLKGGENSHVGLKRDEWVLCSLSLYLSKRWINQTWLGPVHVEEHELPGSPLSPFNRTY